MQSWPHMLAEYDKSLSKIERRIVELQSKAEIRYNKLRK